MSSCNYNCIQGRACTCEHSTPLPAPKPLPSMTEDARTAWLNGWWSGLAIGAINGLAGAVLLITALK